LEAVSIASDAYVRSPTTEILMSVLLYAFDHSFEGRIPVPTALKWESEGIVQLVREKRGRNKGKVRRAVMRRRPGDPHVTTLRDHIGQAYSYRHDLEDGHRPWALRPLGHRIRNDESCEYDLAPPETRPIFLRVVLDCMATT
jgi:hypothetical protein